MIPCHGIDPGSIPGGGVTMTRIYTKEVEHCGYGCPSYHCDEMECGGGDYQFCDLYKKEIYGNKIVDGFPTFCKLSLKKSDMIGCIRHGD